MSKRDKEKARFDLKKLEKRIELESKRNIRWIIITLLVIGGLYLIWLIVR